MPETSLKEKPEPNLLARIRKQRVYMYDVLDHVVRLGFSPATVIDVGVGRGSKALYTHFANARFLLIEPLQEFEENLKAVCLQYRAEYVLAAACAKAGTVKIGIEAGHMDGTSLLNEGGVQREVPAVTLDEVCQDKALGGPFLIKVDVQGAELDVLEGAQSILRDTEIVILEVSLFRFYKAPVFHEVIAYMKQKGFVAYEIYGAHNRPLDGAQAQVDIVFVKENGRFRSDQRWATPEQQQEFLRLIREETEKKIGRSAATE